MKKLVLLGALMIMLVSTVSAQEKMQDRDQERIMLVNGDVLQIQDREQIRLRDKIVLNDGTTVNPNGTYTTKDGKKLRLRNGECLDNDGIKYRNEYQYRYKVEQENKGLSQKQIEERNRNRYQIMVIDRNAYKIMNQFQNRITEQLRLNNGTIVHPDGTYQTQNKTQLRLQNGECLNMKGQMYKNTMQHRKMIDTKATNKIFNKNKVKKQSTKKSES